MTTGTDGIAARLRALRGSRTPEEVGALVGTTIQSVYRYEKERTPPHIPTAKILQGYARAFGVTVEWILTGKDASQPDVVKEAPAPYGLDRSSIAIVRELEALLEVADEDVKRHLRQQIALLWRGVKTTKGRKSGND